MRPSAVRPGRAALLALAAAALVTGLARPRALEERLKDASDALVGGLLRATSQFGSDLTRERLQEQPLFRQRRLRNLR